jgi:hypothetical protein
MNSETAFSGFRGRLSLIIGNKEPFVWAKHVGIPSSTFDRIWNGGAVPKADTLFRIARYSGVQIDWLLTGEGPMRLGEAPPADQLAEPAKAAPDAELVGRMVEAAAAVYKELGHHASLRLIASKGAEMAAEIAGSGVDLSTTESRIAIVNLASAMLRRQLREAAAAPVSDAARKLQA